MDKKSLAMILSLVKEYVDKKMRNVNLVVNKAVQEAAYSGSFKGDKGQDGKDGLNGRDGIDGKAGVDGKDGLNGIGGVDGENGLDGRDGKDGIDGNDGVDGKDGEKGERGERGLAGIDGLDGVDGKDGRDGLDGRDGVDGKDGIDGKDGKDGLNGMNGLDGLSAYQQAVAEGFRGNEAEWLESLVGDKPKHEWNGTQLRFENPDGTWGDYVELRGQRGLKGSSKGSGFNMDNYRAATPDDLPTEIAVKQNGQWVRMSMAQFADIILNSGDLEFSSIVTAEE